MRFDEIKKILSEKTIGIAGAGGLGSNCAAALARVGIGKLIIADFDIVSESNLNRQYYFFDQIGKKKVFALEENLIRINPEIRIIPIDEKLNPQSIVFNFGECDVIVEAFDLSEMKQMIIETVNTYFPEKPLVCAMGLAGIGHINDMKIHQFGKLYICGDMLREVSEDLPPIAPRVGIAANMQADVVLQCLLNQKTELL
jgi:sulfur carrier protein ThiS adenylyltransferase